MATTPRPLIFERILTVTDNASNAGRTVQFDDGDGKIYYQKGNKIYSKDATVTQGHWQNMTLGNETQESTLNVKSYSIDQAIPRMAFGLAIIPGTIPDEQGHYKDNLYLIKDDYNSGTHTETLIHTIL